MIIYLICFIIIVLITYLMEISKKRENKKLANLFFSLIIIVMTTFAGFRDETIGTDVTVYADAVLNAVNNYGFDFTYATANVEIGFVGLAQIALWLNENLNTLLVIIQLIMSICIVRYIYKEDEGKSMTLYIATYLCMFYGIGFNLMRQSIAMSIVLYGIRYVKQNQLIKFAITVAIASLFHSTSLFMIILYPIWKLLKSNSKGIYKFTILVMLIIGIILIQPLINILIQIGILPSKFERYIQALNESSTDVQLVLTIFKILLLGICLAIRKLDKKHEENEFAFFLLLIDFILFQLGALTSFIERISYYFAIIGYLELIPKAPNIVKKDKFNQGIVYVGLYAILIIYFYISFVYLGVSSIVPYTSQILHIN